MYLPREDTMSLKGMVFGKAVTIPSVDSCMTASLHGIHNTAPPGGKSAGYKAEALGSSICLPQTVALLQNC